MYEIVLKLNELLLKYTENHANSSLSRCFTLFAEPGNRLCFLRPVLQEGRFGIGETDRRLHQIRVLPEEVPLPFLQLLPGAELLPDAEHLGEDAPGVHVHVGGKKGVPVEVRGAAAFHAQNVVHRTRDEGKVMLPADEAGAFSPPPGFCPSGLQKVQEGADCGVCVLRRGTVLIEHPEEGLGFVDVGEVRVLQHHEDLQNHPEVRPNVIFSAGNGDGGW